MATKYSHRRVATMSKKSGNHLLAKMCGFIASDELRHATAYIEFVRRIFELDVNEMMLAFGDMMKKKDVMPAHFLRETGGSIGSLFSHFSEAAQRVNVIHNPGLHIVDLKFSLSKNGILRIWVL
ncbi:MAG: acyl-ACP desaturase [Flavobacteriaceae bacterium]|nr:acyl-ACP desaturase [Flavobacteriaceae bacterium]